MNPLPEAVSQRAAGWLARRDAGLSPGEEQEFQAWLAADPAHAEAWREVHGVWLGLDHAREQGAAPAMLAELAARAQRRRARRQRRLLAGLAAAAVITVGFFLWPAPADFSSDGRSRVVTLQSAGEPAGDSAVLLIQPDLHKLADGSVVELNAGALLSVSYTERRREVRLISGEAYFTVVPDAARPFVVGAGVVEVRAVGTAFAVEQTGDTADVLVTEGRVGVVRIATTAEPPAPLLVAAGERVLMNHEGGQPEVETVSEADIMQRLHWRGPKLRLAGAPLAEVVQRLNQINRLQLVIGDPVLADLRFSGSFQADHVEGFVRTLVTHYGIHAEEADHDTIVLRHR
jgi:transmembrane sensor